MKASKSKRRELLSSEAEDSMSEQKSASSASSDKQSSFKIMPLIYLIGLAGLMLSSSPFF